VIGADGKAVKQVSCVKILKRADKEIIKPLLIYNYESKTHKMAQEFYDAFNKHGVQMEENYAQQIKGGTDINVDRKSQILLGTVKAVSANHGGTEVLDFGGAAAG